MASMSVHFPNTPEEIEKLLETKTATAIVRERGKDSFILKTSHLKTIEKMDRSMKGAIFEILSNFVLHDKMPNPETPEEMSALFFIQSIEDANKKYLDICVQNSVNRKKRDEAKKETVANGDGPFN